MLTLGQKAGNWFLEDLVSLGVPRTFRARHAEVGTPALVKLQPLSKATEEQQARELEALRRLRHPSIPEVLDFGIEPRVGVLWSAFAWYEGESLLDRLQRGPMDWKEASRVLYDVASALAYVHAEGLVHRDVRPANVSVGEARSFLTGFDFAMSQAELERLSHAPFGELAYLAPEVLRDPTHHGSKADVYAFGCLCFEALTGRPAFPAAAWGERADQATRMLEWKTRSAALDPGAPVPDWLRSLVTKCTEPDTDRRLPDLEALAGWLDAARASWGITLAPVDDPSDDVDLELTEPGRPPVRMPGTSLVLPTPSLAPPAPPSPEPAQGRGLPARAPAPAGPLVPPSLQYALAVVLGCLSAFGFSAVLILFVEMSNGNL